MKLSLKDRTGILIAVRMKSNRLKRKALAKICDKPVIVHLIERMKRVENAGKIILCTSTHPDDEVLIEVAEQQNIIPFGGSEVDVMKRFIDAAQLHEIETVVRVTGDNPLTDPDNIDKMIVALYKNKYDFVKSEYLPLGVNAEVITTDTLIRAHEMAVDTHLTEYMTSFLKRPDIFNIYTYIAEDPIFKNRSHYRLTVDFEEDLLLMKNIYNELYLNEPSFGIKDVLQYIDKNPDLLKINEGMLEIPLPKIRFKGQKQYEKKAVIIIDDISKNAKSVIDKIEQLRRYEIVGIIDCGENFQYTLVEGIPTLGQGDKIDSINISADYFYISVKEPSLREKLYKKLVKIKKVPIIF